MSAAPQLVPAEPSRHFRALLSALLNATTEDYDDCLDELNDYVAAVENVSSITPFQQSVNMLMRTKEKERKALRHAIQKLPRYSLDYLDADCTTRGIVEGDVGDYVNYYEVMGIVK